MQKGHILIRPILSSELVKRRLDTNFGFWEDLFLREARVVWALKEIA